MLHLELPPDKEHPSVNILNAHTAMKRTDNEINDINKLTVESLILIYLCMFFGHFSLQFNDHVRSCAQSMSACPFSEVGCKSVVCTSAQSHIVPCPFLFLHFFAHIKPTV